MKTKKEIKLRNASIKFGIACGVILAGGIVALISSYLFMAPSMASSAVGLLGYFSMSLAVGGLLGFFVCGDDDNNKQQLPIPPSYKQIA